MLIFEMTAEIATEYFERKQRLNAKTEAECTAILVAMAQEGLIKRAWETKRSKEQFVKDLSREHRVLEVKSEQKKGRKKNNRKAGKDSGQSPETN